MATSEPLLPTPRAGEHKGGKYQYDRGDHSKPRPTLTGALSSSRAGSRASRSATPDEEKERKTTAISGRKCYGLFESLGQRGSSVKMLRDYLVSSEGWYSRQCALTWKIRDTKSRRLLYQLSPSVRPTDATASGLLPTARAGKMTNEDEASWRKRQAQGKVATPPLALAINLLLPTPVANDDNKSPEAHLAMKARMKGGPRTTIASLQVKIKSLAPTPTARDFHNASKVGSHRMNRRIEQKRTIELSDLIPTLAPTPQAIDASGEGRKLRMKKDSVRDPLKAGSWRGDLKDHVAMLPTPAARDHKGANSPEHLAKKRGHHDQLPNRIALLPTVKASDVGREGKPGGDTAEMRRHSPNANAIVGAKTGLRLQPIFVEWMMGYPPGWTDLNSVPQATGGSGSKDSATPGYHRSRSKS